MDIIGLFKFKDKTQTTFENKDIKNHDFNQKIAMPWEEYGVSKEKYQEILDNKVDNEIMRLNELALFVSEQQRTPAYLRKPTPPELKVRLSNPSKPLTQEEIYTGNKMALEYSRKMRIGAK